jgi:corticotropin releasing hormone receptor 1
LANGNWAERADYSKCTALLPEEEVLKRLWNISDASTIYQIGYGASLIALAFALAIFVRFQELGCMRNRIHTHLIATYLLMDVSWMTAASLQAISSPNAAASRAQCLLFISLTYLTGTNFFWMFVEGLYLYLLVVQTFTAERLKLPHYALIGWGVPAVLLAVWLPLKYSYAQSGR